MQILSARNPHQMLPIVLDRLFRLGLVRQSRNGVVLQLDGPTLLCYERPMERVLFWPERDANPFFHLAEALWMLAGRCDVAFVEKFAKRMAMFSDDGKLLNGAYGYRWRANFGYDQLDAIVENLKKNKDCRRQVLAMWDGTSNEDYGVESDLQNMASKDLPCNTHAYFAINYLGSLDITVCNRSNDAVWGCVGANVVHFSFLLEYMAARIGVPVGRYFQFTNNLHGYLDTIEPLREITRYDQECSYALGRCSTEKLADSNMDDFESDLKDLDREGGYKSHFFQNVYLPARQAHQNHKLGLPELAMKWCDAIKASDWRIACKEWLQRRHEKNPVRKSHESKAADDGVSYEQA